MNKTLGDRMKAYEARYEGEVFSNLPFVVRVDGRNFSGWTRHLERPYDWPFIQTMISVAKNLVDDTQGSVVAYTQSDEISLVFYEPHYQSELMFGGRVQKLASVCASMATMHFNRNGPGRIGNSHFDRPKHFDGRCFGLPSLEEAYNYLLWRERDATRNSIRMAGQEYFSHSELHGKSNDEVQEMLWHEEGINWNDYPAAFKRGLYIQKVTREEKISDIDNAVVFMKYPPPENGVVERSEIKRLDIPPISQLEEPGRTLFNEPIEV